MTDADEPAVRRVSTDGITVEKSLAEDRFPVPAVQFQITSELEDEVEVRVTDEIPESVPMDHIGFHPDFESEQWTAFSDHRVRFERPVQPGEEVETVYGIRDDESFDSDAFLRDPSVSAIDPNQAVMGIDSADVQELLADGLPEDAEGLMQEMMNDQSGSISGGPGPDIGTNGTASDAFDGGDVEAADFEAEDFEADDQFDAIGTESESFESDAGSMSEPPGFDDLEDMETSPEEMDSTFDSETFAEDGQSDDALFRDPTDSSSSASMETDEFEIEEDPDVVDDSEARIADAGQSDADNLAATLLEDLRSGSVDRELQTALRDELLGGEIPPSMEVRLRHLQSRVEDLSAYTDAIESFIDGQGTASVIEELDSELDTVSETVSTLEEQLDTERRERTKMAQHMESLEETLSGVSAVDEDLSEVRTQVDNLESRLGSTQNDLEGTSEEVGAIRSEVRAMSDDVAELADRLDAVDGVTNTVEAVESDLEGLEEAIDDLKETQDSLESWQQTVSDAFGG